MASALRWRRPTRAGNLRLDISDDVSDACKLRWTPLREIVHPFAEDHSWPFSAAGGVRRDVHVGSASRPFTRPAARTGDVGEGGAGGRDPSSSTGLKRFAAKGRERPSGRFPPILSSVRHEEHGRPLTAIAPIGLSVEPKHPSVRFGLLRVGGAHQSTMATPVNLRRTDTPLAILHSARRLSRSSNNSRLSAGQSRVFAHSRRSERARQPSQAGPVKLGLSSWASFIASAQEIT